MATKRKTVYCYRVQHADNYIFQHLFTNTDLHQVFDINEKSIELVSVSQINETTHAGIFVATRKNGIPPKHTPGTDEFSQVELSQGQGLAYPNVVLYSSRYNVILMEQNIYGSSPSNVIEYFEKLIHANDEYEEPLNLQLDHVLSSDAYQRIANLQSVKQLSIKVANPNALIRERAALNGSLKDIADILFESNTDTSMELVLKSDIKQGTGLNKPFSERFITQISRLIENIPPIGRGKHKAIIDGTRISPTNPTESISDTIDVFTDRIKGTFNLNEPEVLRNLLEDRRKEGVYSVYNNIKDELTRIIG